MNENRRIEDTWYVKLYRLWPIVLSIVSIIYLAARVQGKVDEHETRITKLETDMDHIRSNTDLLVEKLIRK